MGLKSEYIDYLPIKDGVTLVAENFRDEVGVQGINVGVRYDNNCSKIFYLDTCESANENTKCVYNDKYVIFYKVDQITDEFLGVKKVFDIDNCLNIEFNFNCLTEKGQEIVDQKTGYTKIKKV